MANYTRTTGANARAQSWDDFEEAQPRVDRTGSWLPLDTLEEEAYVPGPQLRAMPQHTVSAPARRQPTAPQPARTPAREQQPKVKPQDRETASASGVPAKPLAIAAGALLCALAVYATVSAAIEWTQVKVDDLQFGRPRTAQMDAFVGHGETDGVPSHFIAMNLNRQVTIIELPGGDSTKATTIVGPYLFGQGEDLTPVQTSAQDVNGDGKPDLVVSVKNEQLIYVNDGSAFKLITPEEQAALKKTLDAQTPAGSPAPGAAQTNPSGAQK